MRQKEIILTPQADQDLRDLEQDPSQIRVLKAVRRTLALMETNLRHPSLSTHEFISLTGPSGEKIFEAYVQNSTPEHTVSYNTMENMIVSI